MNADPVVPISLADVDTPALIIESSILDRNLSRMQELANSHHVNLRPHVKTHKCVALARRQLSLGAAGVAVAKLGEAEMMAAGGITNIQIANQVVGRLKLDRLRRLAERTTITCAVDSVEQISALATVFSSELTGNVFIEINSGLNRAGVATDVDALLLARSITETNSLRFAGLLTHAGHAYGAKTRQELELLGRSEGDQLVRIAAVLQRAGIDVPVISVGSTPTAPYVVAVAGVTELRVGNYIFNDMNQVTLGVAGRDDCALTVMATVTSRPSADRAILDCGAKALALDRGAHGGSNLIGYGEIVGYAGTIVRLSEEHGIVESADSRLRIGDRVRIIPNHACPVVNLFAQMYLVDRDRVIDRFTVDARGFSQ